MFDPLQTARRAAIRHALAASRAGFDAHEQALTEIILTRVSPPARVFAFSQREEANAGADWLWWWHGRGEWFGVLVQAKRNKPKKGLPWYDFEYRSPDGRRQVDRLLATARQLGVPAVYVLYNHPSIPSSHPVGTPCCNGGNEAWRTRLRVAVLPGLTASWLTGVADAAPQYFRPLECLACPWSRPLPPGADLRLHLLDSDLQAFLDQVPTGVARKVARWLLVQITETRLSHLRKTSADTSPKAAADSETVFSNLPDDRGHFEEPYFEHVLRGLRRQPPWYVSELLRGVEPDELAQELPGVAGVVLAEDLS